MVRTKAESGAAIAPLAFDILRCLPAELILIGTVATSAGYGVS
jgi:hypothetical protein